MIGEPPVLDGALKVIVACVLVATAVTAVGAPGTVAGVTELLVADGVLVPTAFAAVTVKVYVVPLAKPVTVIGLPVEVALNVFVLSIAGVTEFDTVDGELVPAAFVAVMVNVYAVPLLKPVIVIGDEPPFAVKLPMFDVTV